MNAIIYVLSSQLILIAAIEYRKETVLFDVDPVGLKYDLHLLTDF
jgi:hypothetical protein